MNETQTNFNKTINVTVGKERGGLGFGFMLGVGLVAIGAGLLLDAFGIMEFSDTLGMWWPSLLMVVALIQMITANGSFFGSMILFSIGAILQLNKLDFLPDGFWSAFWPLVLILIGVSFISSRWKRKRFQNRADIDPDFVGNINVEGSRVEKTAIFTAIDTQVSSHDFTGGELTALFGGIDVDLRQAKITSGTAYLDVTAIFGGVELRVPPDWNVVVKGTPIFGGIDDKSQRTTSTAESPILVINATAIFGGIDIS